VRLLTRLFPVACSRLRIFICYAHEDGDLAKEIGQTLTNDGHDVFIDANSLKVSTDFNEVIRRAIARAHRFVFLASRHSLAPGAYPQTELGFAQKRWPAPKGRVWPIIVDPSIDPAELPIYLRAVQVHTPKGSIVADLAAEIDGSRSIRPSCVICAAVAATLVAAIVVIAATGIFAPVSFALHAPQQVDFRPVKKPGPDDDWKTSSVALTLIPINYVNAGGMAVRIMDETVHLTVADKDVQFKWFNEVEMRANCGAEWLCTKTSVGPEPVKPQGTLRRETMFTPAPGQNLSWKALVDFVCRSSADTLDVRLSVQTSTSQLLGATTQMRQATCRIDLKAMREELQKNGCLADAERLPVRLSPPCVK
jgi:hypothetical protein